MNDSAVRVREATDRSVVSRPSGKLDPERRVIRAHVAITHGATSRIPIAASVSVKARSTVERSCLTWKRQRTVANTCDGM